MASSDYKWEYVRQLHTSFVEVLVLGKHRMLVSLENLKIPMSSHSAPRL